MMILDETHTLPHQTAMAMLPESMQVVSQLQLEAQDSLHDVLRVLHTQHQPIVLLPPDEGDLFSQPAHFMALWQLLVEREHPPLLCFVLPLQYTRQIDLADHYGMHHAPSVEEALRLLARACLPQHDNQTSVCEEEAIASQNTRPLPPQATEALWNMPSFAVEEAANVTHPAPRRPVFRVQTGLLVLLLGSVMAVLAMATPTFALPLNRSGAASARGTLTFTNSGQRNPSMTQGYNDIVTLSLRTIPPPPIGMAYYAWLMPDPSDNVTIPLLLGSLHIGPSITLMYTSANHTNLLASYSGVRVTLQPNNRTPDAPSRDPKTWQWQGFIPQTPALGDENAYSLLSHLRHVLAKDPTLQANHLPGGLNLWLTQNVSKVEEWASAAQGDWHGMQTSSGDADQLHRQLLRILEYLDGRFYYQRDVPVGSPWLVDPLAGTIGLLESVSTQQPPALLTHVDIHLTGLANAPGHTAQQHQLAIVIDTVLARMNNDLQQVRKDAALLVKMNMMQLRQLGNQALVNEIANLTSEVKSGWFNVQTGENMGGVLWITSRLQQLASALVY